MPTLLPDLRYGARMLWKHPGFMPSSRWRSASARIRPSSVWSTPCLFARCPSARRSGSLCYGSKRRGRVQPMAAHVNELAGRRESSHIPRR
jgi:hypothetical protein